MNATGPAGADRAMADRVNRLGSAEVPVRVYEPETADLRGGTEPWGTLVWAHGGSFVRGTLDWPEADWISRRFAEAGIRVYSVDYVLASDTVKAPAPSNDIAAVLREVRATHGGPVFVGGASAGGHLAVLAALAQAEQAASLGDPALRPAALSQAELASSSGNLAEKPAALLLVYPTLHRVQRPDASISKLTSTLPKARRFGAESIVAMYDFYLGEDPSSLGSADVIGELSRERLSSLPPTVIVNAEADDLRASAEQFAEQLREAGVEVLESLQPGTVHGYMNRPDESPRARRDAKATIDRLVQGLRGILGEAIERNETSNVTDDVLETGAAQRSELATEYTAEPRSQSGAKHSAEERTLAMEPAITEPVSLTLPNGRLNRDAVGWATQPIVDTSGIARGRGRNKRWEYWNVTTPTHIIGLTVSHIDYACVPEVWVYDRETEVTHSATATVIPPRGTVLASTLEAGRSMTRAKDLAIDIDEVAGGTRLRCEIPGVSLDIVAALPEGHERLALVVPWSDTRFQYTVKDLARPATGWLRVDGVEYVVGGAAGADGAGATSVDGAAGMPGSAGTPGEAWATLDHGRGRWPYDIAWNWGAGSGRSHGRVIGVQVGAKWTEGTGVSENAFFVDGRMHKIHGETRWEYSLEGERWREPWRITGGGLDAKFEPFYNKQTRTDLLVLQGHTDQCFGHWSGTFETADGETIEFAGLTGWAEEVHNRW